MNNHHTKYIGDTALTRVVFELTKKRYNVLLPIAEHLPYDLSSYKERKNIKVSGKTFK